MKITGLKKIAGESKDLRGRYYLQVNIDTVTSEAWTDHHVDCNSFTVYHDENVLNCGKVSGKVTMKTVEEIIKRRIAEHEEWLERQKEQEEWLDEREASHREEQGW